MSPGQVYWNGKRSAYAVVFEKVSSSTVRVMVIKKKKSTFSTSASTWHKVPNGWFLQHEPSISKKKKNLMSGTSVFAIENVFAVMERRREIMIKLPESDQPTWIPKSQISNLSEVSKVNDKGVLVVSSWLAESRGWA